MGSEAVVFVVAIVGVATLVHLETVSVSTEGLTSRTAVQGSELVPELFPASGLCLGERKECPGIQQVRFGVLRFRTRGSREGRSCPWRPLGVHLRSDEEHHCHPSDSIPCELELYEGSIPAYDREFTSSSGAGRGSRFLEGCYGIPQARTLETTSTPYHRAR